MVEGLDWAIGQSGTPFEVPLERGKLWEFALATGAADPPADLRVLPPIAPTFLVTAAFWYQPGSWLLERAGSDWSRLLSGGSVFEIHGPPLRVGEVLSARQQLESVHTKVGRRGGRMQFIEFRTEFRRTDSSLAATEHHTSIVTSAPPSVPAAGTANTEGAAPSPMMEPLSLNIASLSPGDSLPVLVDEPVSRTRIVRYQAASGDFNPIHHDDEFARRAGYPSVFSVGMFHAGILSGHLVRLFGPEAVRRFGVQFREQIWPGDILTYGGVVEGEESRTGGRDLHIGLSVRRNGGGIAILGQATVQTDEAGGR